MQNLRGLLLRFLLILIALVAVWLGSSEVFYRIGGYYYERDRLKDSVEWARWATRVNPWHGRALLLEGTAHNSLRWFSEASKALLRFVESHPNSKEGHLQTGIALFNLGLYPNASWHLQRALELNPLDPGVYFHLGNISLRSQQWEEARYYFSKAAELDPTNPDYLQSTALAHIGLRQWDTAEQILLKVIKADPDAAKPVGYLAQIRLEQLRFEEAEALIQQAIAKDTHRLLENAVIYYNAGKIYEKLGKKEQAIEAYRTVIQRLDFAETNRITDMVKAAQERLAVLGAVQ